MGSISAITCVGAAHDAVLPWKAGPHFAEPPTQERFLKLFALSEHWWGKVAGCVILQTFEEFCFSWSLRVQKGDPNLTVIVELYRSVLAKTLTSFSSKETSQVKNEKQVLGSINFKNRAPCNHFSLFPKLNQITKGLLQPKEPHN